MHSYELLMLLLFLVLVLLLIVMNMFVHGLHEGVQADALMGRLFRWFWGWNRQLQWRDLNNRSPIFSDIRCERWNCEGWGRFVFAN